MSVFGNGFIEVEVEEEEEEEEEARGKDPTYPFTQGVRPFSLTFLS